ncbi:MAG: hypothetical protein CMJ58_10715 [Planctomycetaceae bacterium]|nr:hypothetical protein [Planctomycetaceae bacterium]
MGQLRFRLPDRNRIAPESLSRIFVAGGDDIPWATRTRFDGDVLVVQRQVDESGYVYVPWEVSGAGRRLLCTSTLMQRDEPYLLDVELARGLVHRLRSRLFIWEFMGLRTPPELRERLREAVRLFARAATNQDQPDEAAQFANDSIATALAVSVDLVRSYAEQTLAARQRQTPAGVLLGATLGTSTPPVKTRRQIVDACTIAQLPMAWRSIEAVEGRRDWKATDEQLSWCQTSGLKIAAGPLLRMDERGVPDSLVLFEDDEEKLQEVMLDHVRSVVSRYAGRVHLWHIASRVSSGRLLSLDEERKLNLVAQALHVVRQIDPRTPMVVSFDQPWGEYLAGGDEDLAPWHYADALVRADLGISGIGLEINAGYWPNGCTHRPAFEYGRLIDQWSLLGLPLMVMLSSPSAGGPDKLASPKINAEPLGLTEGPGGSAPDPQFAWASAVLPLLLARNSVQVVLWNQLTDAEPHEFAHGGLIDAAGAEKPTLGLLRDVRKANVP